jgi:hypothetical protein
MCLCGDRSADYMRPGRPQAACRMDFSERVGAAQPRRACANRPPISGRCSGRAFIRGGRAGACHALHASARHCSLRPRPKSQISPHRRRRKTRRAALTATMCKINGVRQRLSQSRPQTGAKTPLMKPDTLVDRIRRFDLSVSAEPTEIRGECSDSSVWI